MLSWQTLWQFKFQEREMLHRNINNEKNVNGVNWNNFLKLNVLCKDHFCQLQIVLKISIQTGVFFISRIEDHFFCTLMIQQWLNCQCNGQRKIYECNLSELMANIFLSFFKHFRSAVYQWLCLLTKQHFNPLTSLKDDNTISIVFILYCVFSAYFCN